MNNKKKKNLCFLIFIILGFVLISIFNYCIDSNKIFHPERGIFITENIQDKEIPFFINLYKDIKRDTLVIGYSEAQVLFSDWYFSDFFINTIIVTNNSLQRMYLCIKEYIKVHKETKNVVIILPCNTFYGTSNFQEDDSEKENIKDFYLKILLSKDNTQNNMNSVIQPIFGMFHNLLDKENNSNISYGFFTYPYSILADYYIGHREIVISDNMKKFEYLEKIINFLKDNKIEYKIIIPPYNVVHLINQRKYKFDNIYENIKKTLVNKFDTIYDFSLVNRLTITNTFANYNYWFYLPDHPSYNFGYKFLIFLFFNEDSDDSIYVKLNKDNVNEHIEKERKLINQFIANNKDYVRFYVENATDANEHYRINLNPTMPFEIKKDREFLDKKMNEKINQYYYNSTFYINLMKSVQFE